MKRNVIAFDLDDTLAVSKSPISDRMAELLGQLLEHYEVCVITGGTFQQIEKQVAGRLEVSPLLLRKLHMMPTCGTRYYRFDEVTEQWVQQYAEDLTDQQKKDIIRVLEEGAKHLGIWEEHPAGEIIEDRGSQITFSALGQQALPEDKYKWDPDGKKKHALRDYAAERLDNLEVRVGGTTSVDITTIGIDKAYGMNKLIEILGVSKDEILFMGDKLEEGGNDYPVKALGIDSIAVDGWEETALVIEGILAVSQ
ncbi:MAG: HAD-IIB family hydrolase [Candidatus Saccharimonadales bacterium]